MQPSQLPVAVRECKKLHLGLSLPPLFKTAAVCFFDGHTTLGKSWHPQFWIGRAIPLEIDLALASLYLKRYYCASFNRGR